MTYLFGDCSLDPHCHELRKGGRIVTVEPRVFDLLLHLLEHGDRLIGKGEINQQVWRGQIVSDWALSTCMKAVRRAIGDTGKKQEYIRTVPSRGYRFVAKVEIHEPEGRSMSLKQADRGARMPARSRPETPSVAVLPFVDMSNDAVASSLADGVTEDLVTELSRFKDFNVIIASSGHDANPEGITPERGARYVLSGTVRRVGQRIRVTARLVDGASGGHVWAERYDCELGDTFKALDAITRTICGTLGGTIFNDGKMRVLRQESSGDNAHELTLRAWAHFERFNRLGNQQARRLAEQAMALAPRAAGPHRMLALTYCNEAVQQWSADIDGALEKGHDLACRALSLDDTAPATHATLGISELTLGRHERAVDSLRKSVKLNPNSADGYAVLGMALNYAGHPEDGLAAVETAMRMNPRHQGWYDLHIGRLRFSLGAYEDAERALVNFVKLASEYPILPAEWRCPYLC